MFVELGHRQIVFEECRVDTVRTTTVKNVDRIIPLMPQMGDQLLKDGFGCARYRIGKLVQFAEISSRVGLVINMVHIGFDFVDILKGGTARY